MTASNSEGYIDETIEILSLNINRFPDKSLKEIEKIVSDELEHRRLKELMLRYGKKAVMQ